MFIAQTKLICNIALERLTPPNPFRPLGPKEDRRGYGLDCGKPEKLTRLIGL